MKEKKNHHTRASHFNQKVNNNTWVEYFTIFPHLQWKYCMDVKASSAFLCCTQNARPLRLCLQNQYIKAPIFLYKFLQPIRIWASWKSRIFLGLVAPAIQIQRRVIRCKMWFTSVIKIDIIKLYFVWFLLIQQLIVVVVWGMKYSRLSLTNRRK